VSSNGKEHVVEWSFAGGWLLLLLILAGVSFGTARQPQRTYRSFVPFIGLVTALLLVGTIVIGSHFFPQE
jgi:energy-coupling factor transporter transmembrane protein EcfT